LNGVTEKFFPFSTRYLVYPKNFQKIASFLENKDTGACVTFYYSYKYMLNLKKLLREHQMKRRGIRKGSNVPRELQNLGISGSDYWIAETSAVRSSRLRSVDSVEGRRGRKPSIMYTPKQLYAAWWAFTQLLLKGRPLKGTADSGPLLWLEAEHHLHQEKKLQ